MNTINISKANRVHIGILTGAILGIWSFIAGLLEGLMGFVDPATFDASQALAPLPPLFLVCLLNALLLTWFINRTQLSGFRLGSVVFLITFGVMFLMTQMETIYFNDSIQIPWQIIFSTLMSGIGVGLISAYLSTRHKKKLDSVQSSEAGTVNKLALKEIFVKFTGLAFVYLLFYFLFGYFIAWQFADLREYYSGSREILPFFVHMQQQMANDAGLILFQLFRGFLWSGIGYTLAINLPTAKNWERMVIVGLALSIGLATPLFVPNPYMPAVIRLGHFFELFLENFIFGVVLVAVFRKNIENAS